MRLVCTFVCCLWICAPLAAATAEATADPLVPLDILLRTDPDSGFTISPDGKYLAFIKKLPRRYIVAFTDLDELDIVLSIPLGSVYPENLRWISRRRVVFEARGALGTASVDGSEVRTLLPNVYDPENKPMSWTRAMSIRRDWRVLHVLPGDREEILVEGTDRKGTASVYRLDVFTGALTEVVDGKKLKIAQWWADRKGSVRLGRRNIKGRIDYFLRDPRSGEISPMTVLDNGARHSLNFDGGSFLDQRVFVADFAADDDVIYLSENLHGDRFRLVRYSLSAQRIIDTVLEDERYDIGGAGPGTWNHFFGPEKKLMGVTYQRAKLHTEWFDERFHTFQAFLEEKYPDNISVIAGATADLDKLLVFTGSDASTIKVVIYLTGDGKLALHSELSPELRDYDIGAMQVVTYAAGDGYELEGYLTLPPNHDGRPVPAVILPHGGPWSRDVWQFDPTVQFFASRGYAVLQVNYRGSTGYGRAHLQSGIQNFSTLMLDDIADGARWLIDSGHARADDIFILGTSYGGYAALMSLVRYPSLYKAAVSLSAPLDLIRQIKDYKKKDDDFGYAFWKYAAGDPRSQKKQLKENSPINRIEQMKAPFIVFHGDQDSIVSVKQAQQFQKALAKANVDGAVTIIRNEGHGLGFNSNKAYFLESALAHFDKYLAEPIAGRGR